MKAYNLPHLSYLGMSSEYLLEGIRGCALGIENKIKKMPFDTILDNAFKC